jgi:hypothetical protein
VVVDRDTPSLEVSIQEMGSTGNTVENDYERFCAANNLHGNRRMLLRRGDKVRVA